MAKRMIIGESGGPTPVIDWEVAGALDVAQKSGWQIYGMINGPGAGLRTTRIKPKKDQYERIAENLKLLGVTAVLYFGGNDSAAQLLGLSKVADIAAIHGIKTIDNDLPATHHCPGYGSATLFNATALKNVDNDFSGYGVKGNFDVGGEIVEGWNVAPVAIYQVMGRKAGWLAQGTGFAKVDPKGDIDRDRAPHIILSKEVTFDEEEFLGKLNNVISQRGGAAIVVQEDLTDRKTGKSLAELYADSLVRDESGNIQHGRFESFSPGMFLAQLVSKKLKVECVLGEVKDVALVPQHIQRSCMMSPVDASEAYKVGAASVDALNDGLTGKSVVLKREQGHTVTDVTDMENIAAKERSVEMEYIDGICGPTKKFVDEFIYLIGGPAAIPHYSRSTFNAVEIPAAIRSNPYVKKEKS